MFRIKVNSIITETQEDKSLLRYLRDDLRLTSAKDGCSEGACGTCTILYDGEAVKACTLTTKMADGHSVLTVEGLLEWEKKVYDYSFGKAGAVQCGFCIPGMVIAATTPIIPKVINTSANVKAFLYSLIPSFAPCMI